MGYREINVTYARSLLKKSFHQDQWSCSRIADHANSNMGCGRLSGDPGFQNGRVEDRMNKIDRAL